MVNRWFFLAFTVLRLSFLSAEKTELHSSGQEGNKYSLLNIDEYFKRMEGCFYDPKSNVIYFDTPKCACTFIRSAIGKDGKHIVFRQIPSEKREIAKIFFVIRNPYQRVISSYLEIMKHLALRADGPNDIRMRKAYYIDSHNICESFYQYVCDKRQNGFYNMHSVLQEDFFRAKKIDLSSVSFIIDFDNLEKDLVLLSDLFDIKINLKVQKRASSKEKKAILTYYINNNLEIQKMIEEIYNRDFLFYTKCLKKREEILANLAQ